MTRKDVIFMALWFLTSISQAWCDLNDKSKLPGFVCFGDYAAFSLLVAF